MNQFFFKKKCFSVSLIFVVALLMQSFGLYSQTDLANQPSLEPAFILEFNGTVSETTELSPTEIIIAALKFSCCQEDSPEWNKAMSVFQKLSAHVTSKNFMALPEEERAEAILTLLYDTLLTKYSEKETSMEVALSQGIYNCVSSSLLYMALAKEAQIEVFGQKTPNHAFCTVLINDKKIDVETTNPYGFNPGTKKAQEGQNNGSYTIVPTRYYSGRQQVSERVFVSLVGGNINSLQIKQDDYYDAVPLAAARYVFVGNEDSQAAELVRQEFDIVCTNYVNNLQQLKQDDLALAWAKKAIDRWGKTTLWQSCIDSTVYNAIIRLLNVGQIEPAKEYFSSWEMELSDNNKKTLQQHIFTARIDWETQNMNPDEALAFLNELAKQPLARQTDMARKLRSTKEYYWQQKIMPLANEQRYLEAASLAQEAINDLGESNSISRFKKQCLDNYGILIHNQFATLANQKKYSEAYTLLEQGLKDLPNSSLLKTDMNKLKRMMNQ